MSDIPPKTIPELWYAIDKRLSAIETANIEHKTDHLLIQKCLDDHEARLRSGLTFTAITTGGGSLMALIAIIKSFFL